MTDFAGKTKKRLKELEAKYGDEEVFAVPYQHTQDIPDGFQKFKGKAQDAIRKLMVRGKFLLRAAVEEDMSFQQIIPYVLICSGFMGDGFATLMNGMRREENEETNINEVAIDVHEPYGTVRDLKSSTPDHVGIVYLHYVYDAANLDVREKDTLEPLWMTKEELIKNYEKFESWAQLIIADMVLKKEKAA